MPIMDAKELAMDVDDLRLLLTSSKRPAVQEWIKAKIEEIERKIASQEKQQAAVSHSVDSSPATDANKSATSSSLPTVKVTNYGWDESDKFVKVYITLQGVHNANPSTIQHSFSNFGYDISISDFSGKNYVMTMKGLRDEIVPEGSQIKQKQDMLLVMMKKKTEGKKWEQLTKLEYDEKQKRKPKFDDKAIGDDPQASLMNMMKQMYEEGDDELKRTIRKAWHEGQNKRSTAEMPSLDDL
ncbi:CS domain protein [Ancylostoma caninum]|uniref:Calcyclin-binding protein n=1 Tax=Ancylostoma caninum TaxID=29170 RepID=A0A368G7J0_ANCCA|nr:CS domain protein [Ancylostoma caninum]